MIVADTNLVVYSVIPGPHDREVDMVRAKDHDWIAPPLIRSELLTVLANYMHRNLLDRDDAVRTFKHAMTLLTVIEREVDAVSVLNLCRGTGCSSYDAEFVWLARESNVKVVAADREMLRAFPHVSASFSEFANS